MHIKCKKGQSTVEYILLVTAVVGVMIVFATNQNGNGLQNQLCSALTTAASDMNGLAGTLSSSHQPGTTASAGFIENTYSVDVNEGSPGQ